LFVCLFVFRVSSVERRDSIGRRDGQSKVYLHDCRHDVRRHIREAKCVDIRHITFAAFDAPETPPNQRPSATRIDAGVHQSQHRKPGTTTAAADADALGALALGAPTHSRQNNNAQQHQQQQQQHRRQHWTLDGE